MLDIFILTLQCVGAMTGLYGAYAMGCTGKNMLFYSFVGFTISNVFLITLFIMTNQWPLLIMQCVFLFLSVRGLCNHK